MMEHRAIGGDLEISAEKGIYSEIRGRAVPYNLKTDVGGYYEIMLPGCFANSIQKSPYPLPLLLFHNHSSLDHVIGHAKAWEERTDGLYGVWRIDTSPAAQEAARQADSGNLTGLSVGFAPISATETIDKQGNSVFTNRECRLLEVSLTPTPAYKEGMITSVRVRPANCGIPLKNGTPARTTPKTKPPISPADQARQKALRNVRDPGTRVLVNARMNTWLKTGGLAYARMMANEALEAGHLETLTVKNPGGRLDGESREALYQLSRTELPRRRRGRANTVRARIR